VYIDVFVNLVNALICYNSGANNLVDKLHTGIKWQLLLKQ